MVAAYANRAPPATAAWVKPILKQKYPDLTNNNLANISGCEEEAFGRIGQRTGAKRDQLEEFLQTAINLAFARLKPAQAG